MNSIMYLIRGLPGSGKTTLAKRIAQQMIAVHCEADQFMVNAEGEYEYARARLIECHSKCLEKARKAVFSNLDVVVSNTFTRRWEMQDYIDLAKHHGYMVVEIVCKGEFENVHQVPKHQIDRMRERWED